MSKTLGEYLKEVRKRLNLSLRDVQSKIGISNSYLSQIENNKSQNPSPKILFKLAEFYKLSYNFLMNLAGYPSNYENSRDIPAFRLGSGFEELTNEEKDQVIDYINYLKSRRKQR